MSKNKPKSVWYFWTCPRMILNLKRLNENMPYIHFKMETIKSILTLVRPNCYMAKVDIKDAYHSVLILPEYQKYLKFYFRGKLYQVHVTRFFISTFSQSSLSSQCIHVRGLFILWNNAGWHWAMACRNWELQWTFPWYNYEIRTKLVQHHFKSKPSASFYICTTTSVHF